MNSQHLGRDDKEQGEKMMVPELGAGAAGEQRAHQVFPLTVGPQIKPAQHEVHPLLKKLVANVKKSFILHYNNIHFQNDFSTF